ncbi:MAG: hypothetical protein HY319_22920 [Armatimonadetes bacterium]|nr:hypothetical protein [Armatimonadota bacterium]
MITWAQDGKGDSSVAIINSLMPGLPAPAFGSILGPTGNPFGAMPGGNPFGGMPGANPFDLASLSPDGMNPAGGGGLMSGQLWNQLLQVGLQQVQQAEQSGDPKQKEQAKQELGGSYQMAQSLGVQLDPEIEKQVRQALGLEQQDQAGGPQGAGQGGGGGPEGAGGGGGPEGGGDAGGGGGPEGAGEGGGGPDGTGGLPTDTPPGGRPEREPGETINQTPNANRQSELNQQENTAAQNGSPDQPSTFQNASRDWGQTAEGNCSAVAALKGAMDRFGNEAFTSMTQDQNGDWNVTMRDGQRYTVSSQELQQAQQSAQFDRAGNAQYDTKNFDPKTDPYDYAQLGYAAMARRNMEQHNQQIADGTADGRPWNYQDALNDLANGESIWSAAELGGWRNDITPIDPNQPIPDSSVVASDTQLDASGRVTDTGHALFVNKDPQAAAQDPNNPNAGRTRDNYGQPQPHDGTDGYNRSLTEGYTFSGAPRQAPSASQGQSANEPGRPAASSTPSATSTTRTPSSTSSTRTPSATSTARTPTGTSTRSRTPSGTSTRSRTPARAPARTGRTSAPARSAPRSSGGGRSGGGTRRA